MRISYWSSDVCSSDLGVTGLEAAHVGVHLLQPQFDDRVGDGAEHDIRLLDGGPRARADMGAEHHAHAHTGQASVPCRHADFPRSEEHTSELQSLMRISYAVFCLKKKKKRE